MAVINKDKYLKDIAAAVQRGVMYFDEGDRPRMEMGGHVVFISSVSYDMDSGELAYTVSNAKGDILPSSHGVRKASQLDVKMLSVLANTAGQYRALRQRREQNISRVVSRVASLSGKNGLSL